MRALIVGSLLALSACDPPPLAIVYVIDPGTCGTSSCQDVALSCGSYINVRVIRPANPATPVASFCQRIAKNRNTDLCAIAQNTFENIDTLRLPAETLQVQVSIWPESAVPLDADGNPMCRGANVEYDVAYGFPKDGQPDLPAIGGSSFVGGDEGTATVELGCMNLDAVNTCTNPLVVPVLATVEDFDTRVSVEAGLQAMHLTVSVGEPSLIDPAENRYQLIPKALVLDKTLAVPSWSGELDAPLNTYACVNVLDDVAQTTAAVTCQDAPKTKPYTLHGTRLVKETLAKILAVLGPLPGDGLTVGIVVDYRSNPVEHAIVKGHDPGSETPAQGDIKYLSADLSTITGTETSTSGIFVVTNAIFGTLFQTSNPSPAAATDTVEKIGGGIDGRVTIVVLQLPPPPLGRK